MNKKISESWRKIPYRRRQLVLVITVPVVFHLLLLVLFRAEAAQKNMAENQIRQVQQLDLSYKDNAALAEYMQIHDPALMTQPNRSHGYSRFLNDFRVHPVPEDVPAPPPLGMPAPTEDMAKPTMPRSVHETFPPEAGDYRMSLIKNQPERRLDVPAEVWLNSRRWEAMEKLLQEECSRSGVQWQQSSAKTVQTVLFIGQVRLNGELENIQIRQSSGDTVLDQLAVTLLNQYIIRYDQRPQGEIVWIWCGNLQKQPNNRGNK